MRCINRYFTRRNLTKCIFVVGIALVVGNWCFSMKTFDEDRERRIRQLQELTQSGVNVDSIKQTRPEGGLLLSREEPQATTRRETDRLVLEFIIGRRSPRSPSGGPLTPDTAETFLYNKDNTPGYFRRRNWHWTLTRLGQYSPSVYTVPRVEVPEQRLPKVFLLGVRYCGWATLYEYLKLHPNIVTVSPEVRYFDLEDKLLKGLDWFKSQMPLSFLEQITVDVNPSYFWDRRAPRKVYKLNKGTKFVIVLRDPVERIMSLAASLGTQKVREGLFIGQHGTKKISSNSTFAYSGVYVKYLKRWLGYFSFSQFHVLEYEELISRPVATMRKLELFLGVPHRLSETSFVYNSTANGYCGRPFYTQTVACPATETSRIRLPPQEQKLLIEFYESYNEELFRVLGQRYDWPKLGENSNFVADD